MQLLGVLLIYVVIFLFGVSAVGYFILARRRRRFFANFLARYVVILGLLFFTELVLLVQFPSLHATLASFTAAVVTRILALFGTELFLSGSTITLGNPSLAFEVTPYCLGGMLYWIYAALVVAEPQATLRERVTAILTSLGLLVAFNVLRITLSIYLERETGVHVDSYFCLFSIAFVLLLWFAWSRALKAQKGLSLSSQ